MKDCRDEVVLDPNLKAVQIQTIDMCNRSCDFCPNRLGLRKTGANMTEAVFERILKCLEEISFRGRISPYLMNESLLDPRLPNWIQAIRFKFPSNIIFINSNGDAIRSESLRRSLSDSGLDGIQINCYDGEEEFKEKLQVVEQWAREDNRILVHHLGSLRKMSERNGKLNVRVKGIKSLLPGFWNRGGHVSEVVPKVNHNKLTRCSLPFEQIYINHRGEVILCCCDYAFEVVLGSIVKTSLTDIWQGDAYRRCREQHMRNELQDLPLCRSCNRVSVDV